MKNQGSLESGVIDFIYAHDGGPSRCRFFAKRTNMNGLSGVFIHVGDMTDHFRLISMIQGEIIPEFKKNEVRED